MRYLALMVKCTTSILLFWLVLRSVRLDGVLGRLATIDPGLVGLTLAVLALQAAAAARRWHVIARCLVGPAAYVGVLRLFLIGQFFGQMLPSTVGGDGVRAWLHHRAGAPLGEAVHGTLIDRFVGLLVLLALVVVTLPFREGAIPEPAARRGLAFASAVGLGACLLLLAAAGPLGNWLSRFRVLALLRDLAIRVRAVLGRPGVAVRVMLLSLAVHLASVVAVWLLARSLALAVRFADLMVIVPPLLLLATIPISLGGWGLRESLMVTGLGFVGVPREGALLLSVLFGLALLSVSLPGGVLWLRHGARALRPGAAAAGSTV